MRRHAELEARMYTVHTLYRVVQTTEAHAVRDKGRDPPVLAGLVGVLSP